MVYLILVDILIIERSKIARSQPSIISNQHTHLVSKIQQAMTGGSSNILSEALPNGTVSNMPWRKAGVTHPNNEIYIDIVEEIDAILSPSGGVISSDVSGSIQAQSNLSGVPDLILTFNDATLIDDSSFHPCVRYARFEKDKVISFVPPDGPFELMRYRLRLDNEGHNKPVGSMPIQVIPRISYGNFGSSSNDKGNSDVGGRISLSVTARSISSLMVTSVSPWLTKLRIDEILIRQSTKVRSNVIKIVNKYETMMI